MYPSPITTTTTAANPPPLHHPTPPDTKPAAQFSQKSTLHLLNTTCTSSLQHLRQAHAVILRTAQFHDHYVSGTLVKCYANSQLSNLDTAFKVFEHIPNPNVFVYNVIIKACLDNNEPFKGMFYYYKMVAENARPNKFTYPTMFKICGLMRGVKEGLQLHCHVVKNGLSLDGHIKSAGIQMYAGFGHMVAARKMLDEDGECDVVCFNVMIDGYLKCGDVESGRGLFERLEVKNVGSWNVLVSGLAKNGMVREAREVFDEMPVRDDISWSSMIDGYVKGGFYKEALEVFDLMQKQEIKPKKHVLSSVLAACANVGALDQGRWIHSYVRRNPIYLDAILGTALADMYAKCGRLDMAWDVFETMKEKEVFTWNAMICGLAMHGRAEDAIDMFFKMQREKFRPNGITFVGLLNACAHKGMVGEGLRMLDSMERVYDIVPQLEHYGCVVDLLGRAGKLEEAEELIFSMPIEPNAAVWGALLGACRIHGNATLGERVGKILLQLEPENSGRYALLSNIYAKAGKWDEAANVRKLMKERGVKTTPGTSMIDLGGVVHEFKVGDGSHPKMKEIYSMLKDMIEKLEMAGYSPNTSQVLFDIDEEEKETALHYHSEKLAIAFGLISTKSGTTIRIVKNLRMCQDCHSAVKLISQVYDREIIVRDRGRYHHFRKGTCSCNEFW
ncbi:pentatricopeptide repeat-containing protein At5g66520-like [Mercurialis annua]|uniref:pentatricopeptide repeat-containing protein At5g66520-like n=1 Tax=Mercurialis annua TaxID=3986 RepID=UPI00215F16DF|nr:pentatricopeptide repeat-containing protein At5g66520-like [Mercurialis annua]